MITDVQALFVIVALMLAYIFAATATYGYAHNRCTTFRSQPNTCIVDGALYGGGWPVYWVMHTGYLVGTSSK